jgi:hypothetical protein
MRSRSQTVVVFFCFALDPAFRAGCPSLSGLAIVGSAVGGMVSHVSGTSDAKVESGAEEEPGLEFGVVDCSRV